MRKTKAPWEKTWKEWVRYYNGAPIYGSRFLFAVHVGNIMGIEGDDPHEDKATYIERWRKAVVRKALEQGKPVPAEVLKDYPDLTGEEQPCQS
jgi:hypothetical protein